MTPEEILKHNQAIKAEVEFLHRQAKIMGNNIIAPCESCPYDGVFRCETCADNYYEGFNDKNYPDSKWDYRDESVFEEEE